MKSLIVLLYLSIVNQAASQDTSYLNLTAAQRVANTYSNLLSVSNTDKTAILKAVQSLEEKGIYSKLISLNIGKYFYNGKCYNLLAPLDLQGAFTLTIESGSPLATENGIQMQTGDKLNTHFVNDLAINAPEVGVFWFTNLAVDKPEIMSGSPFNIQARYSDGNAYVNIWGSSAGIPVPETEAEFNLAQRVTDTEIQFYRDSTMYAGNEDINSPNPKGSEVFIKNSGQPFTLKIFGITEALTEQEVNDLRQILSDLIADLGI